jgi:putative DNA methylase
MTIKYKKKLIEVSLPLEAINKASAREKSIRHGHPSTLHLWWARRPLATCRAVLFAQLVDDPSSHPDKFPTNEEQEIERQRLFKIIEDLVIWENSTNEEVLKRAHVEIRKSCEGKLPPIYDPFSGGCSIPHEAQRLGLPAYGSDLNPVAVMIGKAMIEIPPKFIDMKPVHPGGPEKLHYKNAEGLAEDVKYYSEWIRKRAFQQIGHFYPQVELTKENGGGKATVIAWIWSRTVPSPDPAFSDMQVPISSNFALNTKKGQDPWVIEPLIDKEAKKISYEVRKSFSKEDLSRAKEGTKTGRGNFRCLLSGSAITAAYIKEMGKAGRMGHQLMAIVAQGKKSRCYLPPNNLQIASAQNEKSATIARECRETFLLGETPAKLTGGTCHGYGLDTWGKLFTNRQLVALKTFSELVQEARGQIEKDAIATLKTSDGTQLSEGGFGSEAYSEAVSVYLAFIVNKCSDYWSSLCSWIPQLGAVRNTFARHALPMVWDFVEVNPFSGKVGSAASMAKWEEKAIKTFRPSAKGTEIQFDAQSIEFPERAVISTDPPYYDNIAYADLSDYFFCWMKQTLKNVYPDLFGVLATPKSEELVATAYRHGGRDAAEVHFLDGMRKAIKNMVDQTSGDFPSTIYYAFKQSEIQDEGISSTGWATFLQAVIEAGYAVVGTWPVRTEFANRPIASGTNALANSVVLVCRKKEDTSKVVTRAEFIQALKRELPAALNELQAANIAPADLPQSSIGPGIGIFSRYETVLESDDSPMAVKTALQIINRELDEYFSGIEGEFDAETRFAVTWFEQNGMESGDYGTANNIATARGIAVESVAHAGIVVSGAGKVRLIARDNMEEDWSPETDIHLTHWECCQYLIHALENEGEFEAAILMKKMGGDRADVAKDLAYRLYDICDKNGWSKEGTSYNGLIAVWSDLTAKAATITDDQLVKAGNQMSML